MKHLSLATAIALMATTATAGVTATPRYTCDRGVDVPAVYINSEDPQEPGVVVILVEGRMINLEATGEAASGVRYRFPNDGSGYVWWTHQGTAMLLWHDATTDTETTVYAECVEG